MRHAPLRGGLKRAPLFLSLLLAAAMTQGKILITGGVLHEKTANPGDVYKAFITVKNDGTKPEKVRIYQESRSRSNHTWIEIKPKNFTLPAGRSTLIECTVTVPQDPDLRGTYYSAVVIEAVAGQRKGINVVYAYGCGVVTNIQGGTVKIEIKEVTIKDKNILVEVWNPGETVIDLELYAELFDQKGQLAAVLDGVKHRLYPLQGSEYSLEIGPDLDGKYTAKILFYGRGLIWGKQLELSF